MTRGARRAIGMAVLVGVLLSLFPTTALAADSVPKVTVGVGQALLIALGYYLAQGPWLAGLGFFTLYRPLVAGMLVGLILGDPAKGTVVGATINLVYLGFISAGGVIPSDPALAGWVGATLAIAGRLDPASVLAPAIGIGLIGTVIFNLRMTGAVIIAHWADSFAERGSIRGVALMNWLPSQVWLFCLTFVPVFFVTLNGIQYLTDILTGLPPWVLNGLAVAGGALTAIGIAMNMRFIFRGPVIPYFFLGYLLIVASGGTLPIVVIAALGLVLAYLHVLFTGARASSPAEPVAPTEGSAGPPAAPRPAGGPRVTRGDLIRSWLLWTFFSHSTYNYERLQAVGFAHSMTPIIRRLYQTPAEISSALKRHLVFFNSDPVIGGVIHGAVIAMEEQRANGAPIDDDAINSVKTGLMGPLAGIGDTIDQGTILPILLALGIGIAGVSRDGTVTGAGNVLGPILFLMLVPLIFLSLGYVAWMQGYYRGRTFVTDILRSGVLDRVVIGASVLGNLVLGALAASFVTLFIAPTIHLEAADINIQRDILDKIMPGLLPLGLVLLTWFLLRRRVHPLALVVAYLAIAIAGSCPIFGRAPRYVTDACGSAVFQPYGACPIATASPLAPAAPTALPVASPAAFPVGSPAVSPDSSATPASVHAVAFAVAEAGRRDMTTLAGHISGVQDRSPR
jgi:PTS system mannose-specific IID component